MNEAFVDFTGGVGEVLYLRQGTPGLFSALRHALAKESLVGATALVRESASHGDPPPRPEHSHSWKGAGVTCPPLCFHCCLILSHKSNTSKSKGHLFTLRTNQSSGIAGSRRLVDVANAFFYSSF